MKGLIVAAMFACLAQPALGFEVTTYNLGLAHTFVPYAKERTPHLAKALEAHNADVLCLQEVWTQADRDQIVQALGARYPYRHFLPIEQKKSKNLPTCGIFDLFGEGKIVSCMRGPCGGKTGDNFTSCVIDQCGGALKNLKNTNPDCAAGLMAQVGKPAWAAIVAVLNPFSRAGLFAYEGSSGVLILSRHRLSRVGFVDFSDISTLNRRVALEADVEEMTPAGARTHTVYCTHLTANLSVPYPGSFKNWEAEHLAQIRRLAQQAASGPQPTYIAGDMNCGFKNEKWGITPKWETNCQSFIDGGFRGSHEALTGCSWCAANTLNDEKDGSNKVISHVFYRGATLQKVSIEFTQPVEILSNGTKVETNLSDHYGVSASFE